MANILKSFLFLYVIFGFFLSCLSKNGGEKIKSDVNSPSQFQKTKENDYFFGQNFSFRNHKKLENLWLPFALISENQKIEQESDFYLGSYNDQDEFVPSPQKGFCKILNSNYFSEKKLYQFRAKNNKDSNELFFIFSKNESTPVAAVRLDDRGVGRCFLPDESYYASLSYGLQRKAVFFESNQNEIPLPLYSKKILNIEVNNKSFIKQGDLIRIGRREYDYSDLKDLQELAGDMKDDLYSTGNDITQDLGVDEYLKTTLLVSKDRLQIALDEGAYRVVVLRKNRVLCFSDVDLFKNEKWDLSCPFSDDIGFVEENVFEFQNKIYYADPNLIGRKYSFYWPFQQWFFSDIQGILLQKIPEKKEGNKYVIIYKPLKDEKEIASAIELPEELNLDIKNSQDQNSTYKIPFAQYYEIVTVKHKGKIALNHYQKSNGANLKILTATEKNGNFVFDSNNIVIRFRLFIPSWNSTNRVELYVDGDLYTRWVISRDNFSQFVTKSFEGKISKNKNFKIKFMAKGDVSLPDFIYGQDGWFPLLETQTYCVDIENTGKC